MDEPPTEEKTVSELDLNPPNPTKKDDGKEQPNPIWGTHSDPGSSTADEQDRDD